MEKPKIFWVPLNSIHGHDRNSRLHSEEQIDQIAASIKEFGFTSPIIVDEDTGTIIAGHARHRAAIKLGLATVPTICVSGWSEAKKRAYMIADNKLAMNATWDFSILAMEVAELKTLEFNRTVLGFDDSELASLDATMAMRNISDGQVEEIAAESWKDMPEFVREKPLSVLVLFETKEAFADFEHLLGQKITAKSTWHPRKERQRSPPAYRDNES